MSLDDCCGWMSNSVSMGSDGDCAWSVDSNLSDLCWSTFVFLNAAFLSLDDPNWVSDDSLNDDGWSDNLGVSLDDDDWSYDLDVSLKRVSSIVVVYALIILDESWSDNLGVSLDDDDWSDNLGVSLDGDDRSDNLGVSLDDDDRSDNLGVSLDGDGVDWFNFFDVCHGEGG